MSRIASHRTMYSYSCYRFASILLSSIAAANIAGTAEAQTVINRLNNGTAFDTSGAWSGGVAPTSAQIAGFSATNTASTVNNISAGVNFQIAGMTYVTNPGTNLSINGGTGSSLTLGSSGINLVNGNRTLTLNANTTVSLASNQTWTTGTAPDNTSQIVINSVISGGGRLTIEGTAGSALSPVYLNALNTFTGGVVLNSGGAVRITSTTPNVSGGLPVSSSIGTGNLTINGGTVFGGGVLVPAVIAVNGDFAVNSGISGLNGRLTIGGGALDLGGSTRTVSLGRFQTATASLTGGFESIRFLQTTSAPTIGVSNGTIRFIRGSSGTPTDFVSVNFGTGASFATGAGLTLGQNVITTFATGNPFGTTAGAQPIVAVESGGYLNLSDAANGRSPTIRTLSGAGTVTNISNNATAQTSTLTINPQLGDASTFSGTITNGSSLNSTLSVTANGIVALTKTGAGTQILSGANTYSGATTIIAGTLQLGNGGTSGSLSSGSAITNNGTLAFNRSDTITQGNDFASAIGGTGLVIQQGAGTLVLNGNNTYSGGTFVSQGTLTMSGSGTLGTGSIYVSGGTLNLGGKNISNTLASLTSGTLNNGTITNDGGTYVIQGGSVGAILAGSNNLTKSGSGTATLNAANSYTGNTTISAGTLALGASGAIDNSSLILANSVLDVSAKSDFTIGSSQTLAGMGSVTGTVSVSGTLAPGSFGAGNVGTFSVSGAVYGTSGASFNFDIGEAGNTYDILKVGSLNASNVTLTLTNKGQYTWLVGDVLQLFQSNGGGSTSIAGSFFNNSLLASSLPTLSSDLAWDLSALYSSGRISVVSSIPEPSACAILAGLAGLGLAGLRRRRT